MKHRLHDVCSTANDQTLLPLLRKVKYDINAKSFAKLSPECDQLKRDQWGRTVWMCLLQNKQLSSAACLSGLQEIETNFTIDRYTDLSLATLRDIHGRNLTFYLCRRFHGHLDLFKFFSQRKLIYLTEPIGDNMTELDMFIEWGKEEDLKEKISVILEGNTSNVKIHHIKSCHLLTHDAWLLKFLLEEKGFVMKVGSGHSLATMLILETWFSRLYHWGYDCTDEDHQKKQLIAKHRGHRTVDMEEGHFWLTHHECFHEEAEALRWLVAYEGVKLLKGFPETEYEEYDIGDDDLTHWILSLTTTNPGKKTSSLSVCCMRQILVSMDQATTVNHIWCVMQLPLPYLLKRFLCFNLDMQFMT